MNRRVYALIVAGAAGAGVHAAIAPEHLREWLPLGAAFVATSILLAAAVAALALRPADVRSARLVAVVLATVVVGYVATRVSALPPLDPEREPLDLLGVCTSAVEAAGLLLALPLSLTPRRSRMKRIFLAAVVAGLAASIAVLFGMEKPAAAQPQADKAVAFSAAMDKLWEDHIVWTRMVIVDFAAGLPDLKTAEVRLLRNQADIGNAIKPYYGAAAGNTLTQLLRAHILGAVPVLAAAKAGDKPKLTAALKAWYANGHQIAAFLSKANPNWPLSMTSSMMTRHLQLTTAEAVARLQGKWVADVAAYDKVHTEILEMSRMLSTGIQAQFPDRF